MVELARARIAAAHAETAAAPDPVDVRVHDLDRPFDWLPDASSDAVLCALAYHHLNDRPGFLAEARRLLRPGGRLVISTHHPTPDPSMAATHPRIHERLSTEPGFILFDLIPA
jgi:SAM-dependent methyltransferase